MIVKKIPNENDAELFQKAERAYLNQYGSEIVISTFDDYFLYIQDLVAISEEFLRIPLDEPLLVIDANTREIKVKNTTFEKNGISVQGDVISEIIFFEIDRYYDATDLAHDGMNIVIQWKNISTKDVISPQGTIKAIAKIIDPDNGKLIFGWPITPEITEQEGTIEFSVRFYTVAENDYMEEFLNYSFSTLPATVKIKPTLRHDVLEADEISDYQNFIIKRLRNSNASNLPESIEVMTPTITLVFPTDAEKSSDGKYYVDLTDEGTCRFKIMAYADEDAFRVEWNRNQLEYIGSSNFIDYVLTDDVYYQENTHYYKINDEGDYELFYPEAGEDVPVDEEIYNRQYYYDAIQAGDYSVRCYQQKYMNATDSEGNIYRKLVESAECDEINGIVIPGPSNITIEENIFNGYIVEDSSSFKTLEVKVSAGNEKDVLSYQWYYKDDEDNYILIEDANENTYSANANYEFYGAKVFSTRNKVTLESDIIGDYRVTLPAAAPTVDYIFNENNYFYISSGEKLSLEYFNINYDNSLSDELQYAWIIGGIEQEEWVENLAVDELAGNFVQLKVKNIYNLDIAEGISEEIIIMK